MAVIRKSKIPNEIWPKFDALERSERSVCREKLSDCGP